MEMDREGCSSQKGNKLDPTGCGNEHRMIFDTEDFGRNRLAYKGPGAGGQRRGLAT